MLFTLDEIKEMNNETLLMHLTHTNILLGEITAKHYSTREDIMELVRTSNRIEEEVLRRMTHE